MTLIDLKQVSKIEKRIHRMPWDYDIFHHCLWLNYRCRVIVTSKPDSSIITGYCVSRVMNNTFHILNLGVDTPYQRSGFARLLLEELISEARSTKNISQIFLEVRPSNIAALELYRQYGFEQRGIKEKYYQDEHDIEDALILTLQI